MVADYSATLSAYQPTEIARVKRSLKRGPRMSRQLRAEFALCQICREPRRLSPAVLAKIKPEVVRIGTNGTRQGFKFAQIMSKRYPELKTA